MITQPLFFLFFFLKKNVYFIFNYPLLLMFPLKMKMFFFPCLSCWFFYLLSAREGFIFLSSSSNYLRCFVRFTAPRARRKLPCRKPPQGMRVGRVLLFAALMVQRGWHSQTHLCDRTHHYMYIVHSFLNNPNNSDLQPSVDIYCKKLIIIFYT